MEWLPGNLQDVLKKNPAAISHRLRGFPTVLWFAVCWSNILCLFTAMNRCECQQKSQVCQILTGNPSTERMSGDVFLNKSWGCDMKQRLTINSYCTVSITNPNVVMVKTQILLCSSWSNIPTLTYKTHLASISSISCNLQHLAQQQSQHKIQWSTLQNRTFGLYWQENTANCQSIPHDDAIQRMNAKVAWKQNGSEL